MRHFRMQVSKEWKDLKISSLLTALCASTSGRRVTELAKVPCRIAHSRDHLDAEVGFELGSFLPVVRRSNHYTKGSPPPSRLKKGLITVRSASV